MKDLVRIMIFLSILLLVFFYFDSPISENEVLEAPRTVDPLPAKDLFENSLIEDRPEEGLSIYIGNSSEDWLNDFGMPARIEPSAFGYEWWVYNQSYSHYMMAGVKDEKIVQVYSAGTASDVAPYEIGQSVEELNRFTIINNEVTVKYGKNIYTFNLRPEDIATRLLVSFDGVYAQLYINEQDEKLEAVRFMDAETLIRHQPYDMMYSGDLITPSNPSSTLQESIDEANAKQVVDLTNVYRLHSQQKPLSLNSGVGLLAQIHSRNMARQEFTTEEVEMKDLNDRLTEANIVFEEAAENTATQYYDAAEAVHGWVNSEDHRETLLSDSYNQIGVGVFGKYYTQSFIYQEPAKADEQ